VAIGEVTTGEDAKAKDIIRTNTESWDSIRLVQNAEVESCACIWTGHLEYCGHVRNTETQETPETEVA
jgi:hypothetical protein